MTWVILQLPDEKDATDYELDENEDALVAVAWAESYNAALADVRYGLTGKVSWRN